MGRWPPPAERLIRGGVSARQKISGANNLLRCQRTGVACVPIDSLRFGPAYKSQPIVELVGRHEMTNRSQPVQLLGQSLVNLIGEWRKRSPLESRTTVMRVVNDVCEPVLRRSRTGLSFLLRETVSGRRRRAVLRPSRGGAFRSSVHLFCEPVSDARGQVGDASAAAPDHCLFINSGGLPECPLCAGSRRRSSDVSFGRPSSPFPFLDAAPHTGVRSGSGF